MAAQAMKAGAVECLAEPVRDQHRPDAIGQDAECDAWHASSAGLVELRRRNEALIRREHDALAPVRMTETVGPPASKYKPTYTNV
jgi:FixJ family two-component response regulator